MKILKSINVLALSFVFLFAVACGGKTKSTETETTITEEPVEVQEVESEKPVIDSTTVEAEIDSVMTEAVDSVSAEG